MKKLRNILLLQAVIVLYTFNSVLSKTTQTQEILSWGWIIRGAGVFLILAVYAILWQQMIKRFDLSIAYANRSMSLLWTMVWSVLFFGETVTWQNLLGVALVMLGVFLVNSDDSLAKGRKQNLEKE